MCDAKNKKRIPIKSIRVIVYESDQDSTHIKVYAHKGDTDLRVVTMRGTLKTKPLYLHSGGSPSCRHYTVGPNEWTLSP